jgi:hypothetical protein
MILTKIPTESAQFTNSCNNCAHLQVNGGIFVCAAYPDGIPTMLGSGHYLHDWVFPDQQGTDVWQEKPKRQAANIAPTGYN